MHRLLATPMALSVHESVYEFRVQESPLPSLRKTPMPLVSANERGTKFTTPAPNSMPWSQTKSAGKRRRATPAISSGVLKHKKHASVSQAPRKTFNATTPAPKSAFTAAVIESRNKRQVGIAILNLRSPELDLYTLADNPTYSSTIRLLHLYDPTEILMSDTSIGSNLNSILSRELEYSRITIYQRKYFNEDQGQLILEQKATKESLKQLSFDPALFLCFAASNCLLKWVAFEQSDAFAPRSIKVLHKTLDGYMTLCMSTIKNLEILSNAVHHNVKKGSLFSTINFCKTPLGERLLRSNLMQPLNRVQDINERLDAVEELLQNEDIFFSLIELIPQFASLDLVNNGIAMVSNASNERTAQQSIANLLLLKQALKSIPTITEAIKSPKSRLLTMIVIGLSNPIRDSIIREINEVISEEAIVTDKMPIHVLHTKVAFAVKPGLNGLLDVGRATYCEIIEAIHEEIQSYMNNYDLPTLRKHFNATRGFYLSLPLSAASSLPDIFIQIVQHGKRINFSTADLISLDDRRKESLYDVLILTDRCLQDLSISIRKNLDYLLNVAEHIALLDLLLNFANLVTQSESYIRPNITQDGPIAISKGRHPIKESISKFPFIPNDVYLNEVSTLHIVTGPNGAGKSTYLRQIALLVILCHIGSYIPAAYASVPVIDQIFTRMAHGDNIEGSISGFMLEAQEASAIIRNATKSSLVLIDEFGRSTSTVDGVGLAWALIEELIQRKSYCLFATHFHELTEMKSLYPQIKNVQLKVSQVNRRMNFCYRVEDGSCKEIVQHYGIQIAELAMFPPETIEFARRLSDQLRKHFNTASPDCPSTSCFYDIIQKLVSLRHCSLSLEDTVVYLRQVRESLLLNQQNDCEPEGPLHYQMDGICEPEECSNESGTQDETSLTTNTDKPGSRDFHSIPECT